MESEKMPLVSVVMPAYNKEKYIAKAINSVIDQTIADWELIVIDDCSTDGTRDVIAALAANDPRIRFVCNEVNLGAAGTRNKALDMCRGEYVALLDADDIWYPEKLAKQIALLRESDADLAYSSYKVIRKGDKEISSDYIVPEKVSLRDMLRQNWIGCSTVLMTGTVARSCRFTAEFYHEDYVFCLQMLQHGARFVGVTDVLGEYSYYPDSRSGNKLASAKSRWDVYRRYMKLSVAGCLWYMLQYAIGGVLKYSKVNRFKR